MTSKDKGLANSWAFGGLWEMTRRVQVVTFIGAGGKTTCLHSITQELESAGRQVIATATTKVFPEEFMNVWKSDNPPAEQVGACFWYAKVEEKSGKWIGPPVQAVDAAIAEDLCSLECQSNQVKEKRWIANASSRTVPDLHDLRDLRDLDSDNCKRFWAIEGDGARGLKLKCWAPHEPQIPRRTDCGVLVLDGGLWGRILQAEQVHRPAGCLDLLGHVWSAEMAWRYFLRSPVFAPRYGQMSWVILLNTQTSVDSYKLLLDLNHRWAEIQPEVKVLEYLPKQLRLAAGNAKEGKLQWFDLW